MGRTLSRELSRCEKSLAHTLKVLPASDRQRQVRIFGGSLRIEPVGVNEEEVAGGGADQQ